MGSDRGSGMIVLIIYWEGPSEKRGRKAGSGMDNNDEPKNSGFASCRSRRPCTKGAANLTCRRRLRSPIRGRVRLVKLLVG